jgi:eukaryotic-like serine/threonine-protein kinase
LIGRYRVERELGRGAMGVIYQAHDPAIGREVAIKLIRANLIDGAEREDYLARFQREAQAAGRCMHPNIVAIYDFALHEGDPFLAMEFVEGTSLADVLRQHGRFAPADAVDIVLQVLDALACAHLTGVVHRDVKPANILLLSGNRVKMTDFGIARFDSSELTQHGAIVGTPSYMSPEQWRGEEVDARSDLFAAGAVLYEMLSGVRAFAGRDASEVMYRLLREEPADLDSLAGGLAAVLRRALAKTADGRFGSAQEMAEAVRGASVPAADAGRDAGRDLGRDAGPDLGATVIAPGSQSRITEAEGARAERALAAYLGPIAKVLVKRELRHAASPAALWQRLAEHIDVEAERAVFLRQRDR